MKHVRLYQNTLLNIGEELTLNKYASHHLVKVLRFPQGQSITLFNGDGFNYRAEVFETNKHCRVKLLSKDANPSESKLNLTLAQGVAKGEKMDFLIQKSVELGVNKIIPIMTERCVVKLSGDKLIKRTKHWQKIVIGACEQSGRSVIPEMASPIGLDEFLQQPGYGGSEYGYDFNWSRRWLERGRNFPSHSSRLSVVVTRFTRTQNRDGIFGSHCQYAAVVGQLKLRRG